MNETTTVPATQTASVPETKSKTPGPLNQTHARALSKAERTGLAAQNPNHAPALAAREISKEYLNKFLSDVDAAREKAADAMMSTTARKNAVADEAKAAYALLAGLQEVQKAAKQKYARTNRIALDDYFVGKKLNGSRPNLLQTSQTILNRLAEDTVPGVTPAKIKALRAARQAWMDASAAQTTNRTAALTQRAEFKAMIKGIEDRKVAIQLAADAEWPHTEEAHAGIRSEFSLPTKRPLIA